MTNKMSKATSGPWKVEFGSSDWGLPHSHRILKDGGDDGVPDDVIAEIPSITPYCIGSTEKERASAARQQANACLIKASPLMHEALEATRAIVADGALVGFDVKSGDWAERLYANQAVITAALAAAEREDAQ